MRSYDRLYGYNIIIIYINNLKNCKYFRILEVFFYLFKKQAKMYIRDLKYCKYFFNYLKYKL